MYSTITEPCPDLELQKERAELLEAELFAGISEMAPVLVERNAVNENFQFHLEEGSNAYAMGDRETWSYHKKLREPFQKELYPLKSRIEEFKDKNAALVKDLVEIYEQIDKATGNHREYTHDVLGNATRTINYPDNTPEWHEQRAKGIGGSDVGAIMGVSPWNTREDIFKLKTGQTQPDVKKKSGALWRGSIWENYIARQFALRNPDKVLVHCKSSWMNENKAHQFANIDGLLYPEGSDKPDSILEIKTSSTPYSWENGVPAYYRMQVLWYMDAFGIQKGYLAVMVDDHDYRQYEIVPRPKEMQWIHSEVDAFVAEVEEYKTNKAKYDAIQSKKMESLRPA
jgi:putative phage-type endonuclease